MTIDPDSNSLVLGIVGAGTMGRGIAQVAAQAGIDTIIYDAKENAAADALKFVGRMIDRQRRERSLPMPHARQARGFARPPR